MAVEIGTDLFVVIWISSVVGAILSHYLPKNILKVTKSDFLNMVITALLLGFGILVTVIIGLSLFNIVGQPPPST